MAGSAKAGNEVPRPPRGHRRLVNTNRECMGATLPLGQVIASNRPTVVDPRAPPPPYVFHPESGLYTVYPPDVCMNLGSNELVVRSCQPVAHRNKTIRDCKPSLATTHL